MDLIKKSSSTHDSVVVEVNLERQKVGKKTRVVVDVSAHTSSSKTSNNRATMTYGAPPSSASVPGCPYPPGCSPL